MTVADKLASSLGERGDGANIALAKEICKTGDETALTVLVHLVETGKAKIQSDCIKVLYEIGAERPELIASHAPVFLRLIGSKNNRLQWGAMTALDYIAPLKGDFLAKDLTTIIAAADKGSVITRDHVVGLLAKLAQIKRYYTKCMPLLFSQLKKAPDNQLPMYAEITAQAVSAKDQSAFITLLKARSRKLQKASQQRRIEKLLKQIS